jgi:xanthine dehydrogenase small subunit
MRATVEFLLNGERVSLGARAATRTLLGWLREERRLTGTKEGCAEGDCGACTVALTDRDAGGRPRTRPMASCLLLVGAADGCEVETVEGLAAGGALHAVQRAMVECHGSQCGFCTPGFVMALYAHQRAGGGATRAALCDALAGNLCRCTGYAPILAAGLRLGELGEAATDQHARSARLAQLPQAPLAAEENGCSWLAPRTADGLARALAARPAATLLAGGTDLGLLVTKQLRGLPHVVHLGRVAEMRRIEESATQLEIGGAVTLAEAHPALARVHPDLGELVRRFGGAQVRASATLAGNIANGSPIGDLMPPLLALGASLALRRGEAEREVPLEGFYAGYRRSVLAPGEFIRAVRIPKLAPGARFACYKLSRRFDQDISAVCAAFHVSPQGEARFGFGGMAATPARAPRAEAAWRDGLEAACAALGEDFRPLSDHRASAWYRLGAARNLLRKFAAGVGPRALLELEPVA